MKYIFYKKLQVLFLFFLAIFISSRLSFAQNNFIFPFANHIDNFSNSLFKDFNSKENFGHIRGKIKSFTIWENDDAYNSNNSLTRNKTIASSLALTLNYKTPIYKGLSSGFQYVHAVKTYDGHHLAAFNDAYDLHNEKYRIFNELYANYNFKSCGWEKTNLKVGRQIIHLDFFKKFALHQKEQAIEGVALTTDDISDISLTAGYIKRFSGWSSRNTPPFPTEFVNLGDQLLTSYHTAGANFISANYKGLPKTSITVYDWALYDLMNVLGAKITYTFGDDDFKIIPRIHFAWQRDIGKMEDEGRGKIVSHILENAITLKWKSFSLEPSYTWVSNNKENELNNFLNPFDSLFVVDSERGGPNTRQLNAGSQSYVLKTVFSGKSTKIFTTCYYTIHPKDSVNSVTDKGTRDFQIETDITQKLTENLSLTLTLFYVRQQSFQEARKDVEKREVQMGITYKF